MGPDPSYCPGLPLWAAAILTLVAGWDYLRAASSIWTEAGARDITLKARQVY